MFLIGYIATLPGVDASTGTLAVVVASLVGYVASPLVGHLIDKVGRRPVFRWLSGFQLAFAYPDIYLVNTGNTALILTAFISPSPPPCSACTPSNRHAWQRSSARTAGSPVSPRRRKRS